MENRLAIEDFATAYKQEAQDLLPGTRVIFEPSSQERTIPTIFTYSPNEFDYRCGELGIETLLPDQTFLSEKAARTLARMVVDTFNHRWFESAEKAKGV